MKAWDKVLLARSATRPTSLEYIREYIYRFYRDAW